MSEEIETKNDFLFGTNTENVTPILPVVIKTREQAYRTAVWIRLLGSTLPSESGEVYGDNFETIEQAILGS